jgi:hypothetical protein
MKLTHALHIQNKKENFEVCLAYLNRALAIHEKAFGSESTAVAAALRELGMLLEESRGRGKGLAHLQRALDIQEKALPADSLQIGITLSVLGTVYLNLRQPQNAKQLLERASSLLESSKLDPFYLVRARYLLARALWDTDSDRDRAVTLAQQARATLLEASQTLRQNANTREGGTLREVEAWLRTKLGRQADASLGVR